MEEAVYIKFTNPKLDNQLKPKAPIRQAIQNSIIRILKTIIPKANPDFENKYEFVTYLKVEFDKQNGWTLRELGFDKEGNSVVAGPFRSNYGFWTDNQLTLDDYNCFDPIRISKNEFENDWKEFENKNN